MHLPCGLAAGAMADYAAALFAAALAFDLMSGRAIYTMRRQG